MTSAFTATLTLAAALLATPTHVQDVRDLSKTIDTFNEVREVRPFIENAYGYAVFRRINSGYRKATATGRGQVYVDGKITGFSRLVDFSVGVSMGDWAYSQIVFFEDKAAYGHFVADRFEFDAQVTATPVSVSGRSPSGTEAREASFEAATASELADASTYHEGMRVFTMDRDGGMHQVTLEGQRYSFRPLR
ncbi:MAG: hypothetical protein OXG82_09450 [Gammaproteobacteria bacterium]|nr:hypothetical protein [Gammaproteobacteria bacterium]